MVTPRELRNAKEALAYIGEKSTKGSDESEVSESVLVSKGIRKLKSITCGWCHESREISRDELVDVLVKHNISHKNGDRARSIIEALTHHGSLGKESTHSTYEISPGKNVTFGFARRPTSDPKETCYTLYFSKSS